MTYQRNETPEPLASGTEAGARKCLGDAGECSFNGACMYACGALPEPVAHRYWSVGHRSRWQLAGAHVPPDAEPLFSKAQMLAALAGAAPAPGAPGQEALQNKAPRRIYLDIGDPFALEGILAGTTDWQVEGVTWSEDNATSHGVEYVRADLAALPAGAGEKTS